MRLAEIQRANFSSEILSSCSGGSYVWQSRPSHEIGFFCLFMSILRVEPVAPFRARGTRSPTGREDVYEKPLFACDFEFVLGRECLGRRCRWKDRGQY